MTAAETAGPYGRPRLAATGIVGPVLVTGAAGFIGMAVSRALRASKISMLRIDSRRDPAETDLRQCDLNDAASLRAIIDGPVTSIVHCGAVSGPMVDASRPGFVASNNIVGMINLLEFARVEGVRRFVFLSSVSAYGPTPVSLELVSEDIPLAPVDAYGATKAAGEALLGAYAAQYGVEAVSLRVSAVFGPGRRNYCHIRAMLSDGLTGTPLQIPVGGTSHYQYVHIDDVVRGIVAALDADPSRILQRAYSITGGTYLTLREIAGLVRGLLPGSNITIGDAADPYNPLQARFDLTAARRDLGYEPRVDIYAGIGRYMNSLSAEQHSQGKNSYGLS